MPQGLINPVNLSPEMQVIINSGKATYLDLEEKLSVRDMYNLLESIAVNNYNETIMQRHYEAKG